MNYIIYFLPHPQKTSGTNMTPYQQGIEFIDYVRSFHHSLSEFYSNLKNDTQKEKVKMILDYLSEHECKMESTLFEFRESVSKKVSKTWFSFIESNQSWKCLENIQFKGEMSIDEIVEKAVELDECLISLYKHLSDYSSVAEVKSFFESMSDMESHEMRKIIRSIQRLEDI